jgi:hypothetical protein
MTSAFRQELSARWSSKSPIVVTLIHIAVDTANSFDYARAGPTDRLLIILSKPCRPANNSRSFGGIRFGGPMCSINSAPPHSS